MKPEKTFKVGPNQASIFLNTRTTQSGERFESYSVHLHRRYQTEDNQWKSTAYFGLRDLPQIQLVLSLALAYVAEREAEVVLETNRGIQQEGPTDDGTNFDPQELENPAGTAA